MRITKVILTTVLVSIFMTGLMAQKEASPFDFGKMWTFENPPKDWFKEAYDFDASEEWFEDVRMSSLRFATWCSASFVSPNGLIMTNHHCSRDVANEVQLDEENFDKFGYYASTLSDERPVDGLFVEQLVQTVDITDEVMTYTANAENSADEIDKRSTALAEIQAKYRAMEGWEGLRTQTVTYYSGGRFSLYGYKKYSDIRLVFIPELELGAFGGDPDNFTYPRYNLDVTFWRAYDESGNPLNTSAHYLEFNPEGAQDQEAVFVVGNPGSTERYRTVAQLEYDRAYRYNLLLKFLTNRHDLMMEEYLVIKEDPTREKEAQDLLGTIFNFSNSMKAYGGIIKGLYDEELIARKAEMENIIKSQSEGLSYWDDLAELVGELHSYAWAINHLSPSPYRGQVLGLLHDLYNYEDAIRAEASEQVLESSREAILAKSTIFESDEEKSLFKLVLTEISEDIYPGNNSMKALLADKSIDEYVDDIFESSRFTDRSKAEKCLKKTEKVKNDDDPLLVASRKLIPQFHDAVLAYGSSRATRRALNAKIANQTFQVYGNALPPDATFTLRISDGIVDGYNYNGTVAPYKTSYLGMYDRFYSYDMEDPWSLPEKWLNPPMELLKAPYNMVSTNDIIGGNSGSALINIKGEAVGLAFDGNMESLPGNFIFDDEFNRTISVHSGGIFAALKYIYDADRLINELVPEN